MIVSLNEIENLSLKACRGAGMSWGLAEEAAQAARWLAGAAWHGISRWRDFLHNAVRFPGHLYRAARSARHRRLAALPDPRRCRDCRSA
ncbi:MAG: DUF3726 domain-containing protein [Sphingomonadales bacterium]|nr:DUF3726 domain-containing protein [Sphingomonadales bacterium]